MAGPPCGCKVGWNHARSFSVNPSDGPRTRARPPPSAAMVHQPSAGSAHAARRLNTIRPSGVHVGEAPPAAVVSCRRSGPSGGSREVPELAPRHPRRDEDDPYRPGTTRRRWRHVRGADLAQGLAVASTTNTAAGSTGSVRRRPSSRSGRRRSGSRPGPARPHAAGRGRRRERATPPLSRSIVTIADRPIAAPHRSIRARRRSAARPARTLPGICEASGRLRRRRRAHPVSISCGWSPFGSVRYSLVVRVQQPRTRPASRPRLLSAGAVRKHLVRAVAIGATNQSGGSGTTSD